MQISKVDGLLTERVGAEVLVYNRTRQETHALNETAAIVFDLADGKTTREAMMAEVARRSGLPEDMDIVDYAIAELTEAQLVSLDAPVVSTITRRALIRKLGLTLIAAAALPLIETVVMPARAQMGPLPPTPPGPPPGPSPVPTPTQTGTDGPTPSPVPTPEPTSPPPTPEPTSPSPTPPPTSPPPPATTFAGPPPTTKVPPPTR